MIRLLLFFIGVVFIDCASAEELLRTGKTWEGADIVYPSGTPEITSFKLKIDQGQATPFHCHPVPTMGFIFSGTVEVETITGKTTTFSEGESVVEVLKTLHRGKALDGPVEIVVFYAGVESLPNTVLIDDESSSQHCIGDQRTSVHNEPQTED